MFFLAVLHFLLLDGSLTGFKEPLVLTLEKSAVKGSHELYSSQLPRGPPVAGRLSTT